MRFDGLADKCIYHDIKGIMREVMRHPKTHLESQFLKFTHVQFLAQAFSHRPSRDMAETVLLLAYGLHTRPGQEDFLESEVRNPCCHSINGLNSELGTGKGCLQVTLPCPQNFIAGGF